MTFTEVFGALPVQPAEVSYRAVLLTADTALLWPIVGADTTDVAAGIMDVTAASSGLALLMPPANEVSVGAAALVSNVGANTFTLEDATGGTIVSIAAGASYDVYLTDNADEAGTWRSVQRGATTSSANAGALQGLGTVAIGSTLGTAYDVVTTETNSTLSATDRAKLYVWTGGAGTISFDAVSTLGNNWFALVSNQGSGAVALDPDASETINGVSSVLLNPSDSCIVACSGIALYTVGLGRSIDFATTMLVKDVSGSGNVTLTSAEAGNIIQRYTGTLTGDRNVIVPAAVAIYYAYNNTAGAYNLTVKTATGTGVSITPSQRAIIYCDGTNVVDADTFTPIAPTSFPDGNVGSPSISFQNEANTGIYRPGAGQFGVSVMGTQRGIFSSTGLAVTGTVSSSGAATVGGTLTVSGNTTLSDALSVGKAATGAVVSVAYATTVTLNFAAANAFMVGALTGDITLANPANVAAGQGGTIRLQQDGTGGRTVTLGSQFKKVGSFVTTAGAINVIAYQVFQTGEILAVVNGGFA